MTVAELIAELQKLPPDAPIIHAFDSAGEYVFETSQIELTTRYFNVVGGFSRHPHPGTAGQLTVRFLS